MTYYPNNPNGQTTMANSAPVTIASDQTALTVNAGTNLNTSALALESGGNLATLAGGVSSSKYQINLSQVAGGTAITSGVTGSQAIGGDTASAATDAGNPVKTGTKYNATQPTFTDGQRAEFQVNSRGELKTVITQSTNSATVNTAADAAAGTGGLVINGRNQIYNGSTYDLQREVVNATNSVGTGIAAAGILGQFDDVSPTSITENQFGNIRMSANRNLYGTIRDAAGNERGANVTAGNALTVDASATTQPVSGTVTANIGTTNGLALDATLTGGTQQSKITDGTNVASVLKSDGTAAGQNSLMVSPTYLSATWSVTNPAMVASTDVGNYRWVSVHVTAYTSGTVNFQTSNDNATWTSTSLSQVNVGNSTSATAAGSATMYHGPLSGRYFRLNITGAGSTNAGTVIFSTMPTALETYGVSASQSGTWTVGSNSATGSAVPANAFYVGINNSSGNLAGISSIAALGSDGQAGNTTVSTALLSYNGTTYDRVRTANGASNTTGTGLPGAGQMTWDGTNWQKVQAALLAPSTTALNTYSIHLTSNTTTTPTSSTAYISSVTISNEVAGTTSTITIQDKQGTPLKLVNGVATTALTTTPTVINFQTPVKMVSGIDIITAGAVAATVDVWVNYYQ